MLIGYWKTGVPLYYRAVLNNNLALSYNMGRGGAVVSTLDFRPEGRWFDAQSLPSCCFLRQEPLHHIVSLHPGV